MEIFRSRSRFRTGDARRRHAFPFAGVLLLFLMAAGNARAGTDRSKSAPGDGTPDGMCDVWQQYYNAWGLDAQGDEDGDGNTNFDESIAGTDPRNAADRFGIANAEFAGDAIVLAFHAIKGKRYSAASSDQPGGATWIPLAGSDFVCAQDRPDQTMIIPRPAGAGRRFYRLEAQDVDSNGDGVPDWAEWRRGTDSGTLAEAGAEFALDPADQPILAETFSQGSRFALDRMVVRNGFASGAPGENWGEVTYFFDDPPDIRAGDVVVYWAFRTPAAASPEENKLYMYLNFTDPPPTANPEPGRIALNVRPGTWCVFYRDPGWLLPNEPELQIDPPFPTFPDAQTVEKFRVIVHWEGGDRVTATPCIWNAAAGAWQPFTPRDQPNGGPVSMELSIANHLAGSTVFKSVFFQAYSDYPEIDAAVVAVRPAQ